MADRTVKIQVTLTEEEADVVRREAAERSVREKRRVSMSDVLREMVIAHIEQKKSRKPKA